MERIVALNRVSEDAEYGDLVQCSNCGRTMLVDIGEEICPECDEHETLMWVDDQQEYSIFDKSLLLIDVEV